MRLKSFHGASMAEAMKKVREELGADAIIVSTHQSRRNQGVGITAAVEMPDFEERPSRGAPSTFASDHPIAQVLAYHGVPAPLIERLCRATTAVGDAEPTLALAAAIEANFEFAPLADDPGGAVMLVGPPGVGKTVTMAKLAARQVMAGRTPRIITTDTIRAGGVAQLASFTEVLNLPLVIASTPDELRDALSRAGEDTVAFIDTPGTNAFNPEELRDLQRFLNGEALEPVLVLAAGGDPVECAEIAEVFSSIGARRLITTRLDGARRLGGLLGAAEAATLAFAEASKTPFVGQGLSRMDARALGELLMGDPTHPHDRLKAEK